nr:transposase family protein [Streptomyces sp. NBC_00899]
MFIDRLLATLVHLRLGVTHDVLACWFGVDRSTITRALSPRPGPVLSITNPSHTPTPHRPRPPPRSPHSSPRRTHQRVPERHLTPPRTPAQRRNPILEPHRVVTSRRFAAYLIEAFRTAPETAAPTPLPPARAVADAAPRIRVTAGLRPGWGPRG